ncbi:MAG: transporter substrate-binding domain-containing protein [Acinetobacter sp.]
MKLDHSIGATLLITIVATLGAGCSQSNTENNNAASSATKESSHTDRLKPATKESEILDKNTPAVHTKANPEAIKKIPNSYHFAEKGYFTVAVGSFDFAPLVTLASDNKTRIGVEVDAANLLADSLGLKLKIVPTTWENWPLGIVSSKFDAVFANITVLKEREEKYDLVTYRKDSSVFYVNEQSKIKEINNADDISGLKIAAGSGTNTEKALLKWIADNKKKGLKPAELVNFDNGAGTALALQANRIDVMVLPSAVGKWQQLNGAKIKAVGLVEAPTDVAIVLKKGTGLSKAVQSAFNGLVASGEYAQALARWNLQDDVITESLINPPVKAE